MIALSLVTVGIPVVFLAIRLILHAVDPRSYGPAGGYDVYVGLVAGVLYLFGFIVSATLGATAGSVDLTEGMFRHLVVTGRSRLALYLARIPAGLAIIVPLVAIGLTVVDVVSVYAAPTSFSYGNISLPAQMSRAGLENWAAEHAEEVVCNFPVRFDEIGGIPDLPCFNGPGPRAGGGRFGVVKRSGSVVLAPPAAQLPPTASEIRALAVRIADQDYPDYRRIFLYPSSSLMVKTGLWIELEAIVGFMVGLGLSSLIGQRTVAVILMIVLEMIVTPIAGRVQIPHMTNLQRAVIGLATLHLEPGGLPQPFGGGGMSGQSLLLKESTTIAVVVIAAWLVGWTVLGAWRMVRRDA